jgi:hypothetical protein
LGLLVAVATIFFIGNVLWDTDWFDVITENETRLKTRSHDFDSKRYRDIL